MRGKRKVVCVSIFLNPHVIIKSINRHQISKKLSPREPLSYCLKQLTAGKKFEEADDKTI